MLLSIPFLLAELKSKIALFFRNVWNFGTILKFQFLGILFHSKIPKFQMSDLENRSKFCNLVSFLSEVDAELPLALRKNNFKRLSFRCSRRDAVTCSVACRVTRLMPKMTKSKFGILEHYLKKLEHNSKNFNPIPKFRTF